MIVVGLSLLRYALSEVLPDRYLYLMPFAAVLFSASLLHRGAGLIATVLMAAITAYFYLPPGYSFSVQRAGDLTGLVFFLVLGAAMSAIIGSLHTALAEAARVHAELAASERSRGLLLHEFRHRTRNDLASLAALLLLRARKSPSEAARDGLREAAEYATVLARVHTRLAPTAGMDQDATTVDTQAFIAGLCADLEKVLAGDGLRPVALIIEAEAHSLDTARGVQLGLVLNEAVTNSLKYGFPDDRPGTVRVRFRREGANFVLSVVDNGVGMAEEDEDLTSTSRQGTGLGTRLLHALAAQLRGAFTRRPADEGTGTVSELHFPVGTPGLHHR